MMLMVWIISRTERKRTVPTFVPAETDSISGNCGNRERV
jgi:hypothetical protein